MRERREGVVAVSRDLVHQTCVIKVARGHYLALCTCRWRTVRKQSSWAAGACLDHVAQADAKAAHEQAQRIAGRWGEVLEDRQL